MKGKEWFAAMAFGLLVIVSMICSTLNNDAINAVILQGLAYIGTAGLAVIVIKCMGRLFQGTFSNPY
ncbi:MAG: hypothetical protein LBI53_03510 [Candidatus Peribacteria bacterium]|jgi:hypothetical protein|nr:hypothetical protein [Candidatus Peribacteria bacterium]